MRIYILGKTEKKEQGRSRLLARLNCYLKPGLSEDLGQSLQGKSVVRGEPRAGFRAPEGWEWGCE